MKLTNFYLIACFFGTLIPWVFFGTFFSDNGFDLAALSAGMMANGAAGGVAMDMVISTIVFWVWAYFDAQQNFVKRWWVIVPASCFVGLSLALPLYLYMRTKRLQRATL